MKTVIEDIAYYLPEKVISNEMLSQEHPDWNLSTITQRTGIKKRHIADDNETALDLAFQACQKLFEKNPMISTQIDAIIFCTQSSDYILPPNACILHKLLNLPDEVIAFDFNLACSGYIYGLTIANSLILSKSATHVLLVTADTYSKYIHPQDRSTMVLFGDGAAVTLLQPSLDDHRGIVDIICATFGKDYTKFIIPDGGCRNNTSNKTKGDLISNQNNDSKAKKINMDGAGILSFVASKVPQQILKILERNHLTIHNIDKIIFHQASQMTIDMLARTLHINHEKIFQNLETIGNTVSASIPIAIQQALNTQAISKGNTILISGFGVGLSYASAIVKI